MKFPNAGKGIRRIYLAEILMLCAAIALIGFFLVLAINKVDINNSEISVDTAVAAPVLVLGLGSIILMLAAFVLNLVGLVDCRKDDDNFRIALWASVAGVIVSVVRAFFSTRNPVLNDWMDVCLRICELFTAYYVLTGVFSLAQQIGNSDLAEEAAKARNLLCYAYIGTALVELVDAILKNTTVDQVLGAVAGVASLVAYVIMLRTLNQAKKALN